MTSPPRRSLPGLRAVFERPSVRLALMLWCMVLIGHILFTFSVPGDRQLLILPFVWTAMGLGLTALLRVLISSVEGFPPVGRWLTRVKALLSAIEAVAPAAVDQVQARRIGRLLGVSGGPR